MRLPDPILAATLLAGLLAAGHGSHKPIDATVYDGLRVGQDRTAAIRAALGDPDAQLAGGRVWVYSWTDRTELRITTVVLIGFPYAGGLAHRTFPTTSVHHLVL